MTLRDLARMESSALNINAAFHDYPVTRYVVDEAASDYDGKLRELIDFLSRGASHVVSR